MKKITQFLIVFLVALTLTSCAKQEINNGLYVFPFIGLVLAARKFNNVRKAYKQAQSTQQSPNGIINSKHKTIPKGELGYGVIFLLASIGMAYWIYEENRNYDPKKDGIPKEAPKDNRESAEEQARKADSVHNLKK